VPAEVLRRVSYRLENARIEVMSRVFEVSASFLTRVGRQRNPLPPVWRYAIVLSMCMAEADVQAV